MESLIIIATAAVAVSANEGAVQDFIKGNNLFASSVYKEILRDNPGNVLMSPLSAEIALAFAQSGCKDGTAQEIRNTLHLPDDKSKIEEGIENFLPQLKGGENYTFRGVNKMYIKDDFAIKEEFKTAADIYQSESENIEFGKTFEAAETMNKWVEEQTNNKIHDLISSEDLTNRTRLVLLNALYFKADWSTPFLALHTKKGKFFKTANDVVEVDMMHHYHIYEDYFNYYEDSDLDAKLLELPFKGEDASMIVVLPNDKEGLAFVESQLEKVLVPHNFRKQLVILEMPKFRIESKTDLKKILKNLGVNKAFRMEEADLSGIAGKKGELTIDAVKQKTFIDVNEKGVEAAVATDVLITIPYIGLPRPKKFTADHPFLFYITIKDVIAFVGRVTEPMQLKKTI